MRRVAGLDWRVALALTVCIVLAAMAVTHSRQLACEHKGPRVQSERKAESSFKGEKPAERSGEAAGNGATLSHQVAPNPPSREAEYAAEQCDDEGSESLPLVFGYKLKITDALLVILTFFLARYTYELNQSTIKLWQAGEDQRQLTNEIFVASQRPWISGEFQIAGNLKYTSNNMSLKIAYHIYNHGNTVGNKITVKSKIVIWEPDNILNYGSPPNIAGRLLEKFCKRCVDDDAFNRPRGWTDGISIFPSRGDDGIEWAYVGRDEVDRMYDFNERIMFEPIVLVCIIYYFPFDSSPRYTGYMLNLYRKDVDGVRALDADYTDIPREELVFQRTVHPSGEAT